MSIDPNNLSMVNYRFSFARSKDLEYSAQTVTIPGLNLGVANQPTPFVHIPRPGNITYDELIIQFMVSENMGGYLEIFNWMVDLGHPDNYNQYPLKDENIYSDMSVLIMNSASRGNFNVKFTNAFPVNLTPLYFDATLPEPQYATATVSFRFERFYINQL